MFGSSVLDILLGLITIFLTVSLVVTALNEFISQALTIRTRHLKRALHAMLDGNTSSSDKIDPGHWFFDQPLIASMTDHRGRLPAYLDKQTFSLALLLAIDPDFARKSVSELEARLQEMKLPDATRQLLRSFLQQAQGDLLVFRSHVETWFDNVMARTSGWYKQHMAAWSLVVASIVVVVGNIDTLAITRALYVDPAARSAMVANAQQLQTVVSSDNEAAQNWSASLGDLLEKLNAMNRSAALPIGWDSQELPVNWQWASKILGLLMTVLAASLGAPFWFDALSRVANIRNAGPKPK